MRIRLNKLLATRGVAARRKCDALIASGAVQVNGETITAPGAHVDPDRDDVRVQGRRIPGASTHRYYVLNKPVGMISTLSDPEGRRSLREVMPQGPRVFPVGRLDADTSGLLLLTNDGDLAHHLMHPRYGVEKFYRAVVRDRPDERQLERLQRGVVFEPGVRSAPARVRERDAVARGHVIEIAISEGRYRQVRRMCEAVGLDVVALHRWGYGPLRLGDLERGMWRELSEEEVVLLRAASARPKARPASIHRPRGRRRGEAPKKVMTEDIGFPSLPGDDGFPGAAAAPEEAPRERGGERSRSRTSAAPARAPRARRDEAPRVRRGEASRARPGEAPRSGARDRTGPGPGARGERTARGRRDEAPRGRAAARPRGRVADAPLERGAGASRGRRTESPRARRPDAPRGRRAEAPRRRREEAPRARRAEPPRGHRDRPPGGRPGARPRGRAADAPGVLGTGAPRRRRDRDESPRGRALRADAMRGRPPARGGAGESRRGRAEGRQGGGRAGRSGVARTEGRAGRGAPAAGSRGVPRAGGKGGGRPRQGTSRPARSGPAARPAGRRPSSGKGRRGG